MRRRRPPRGWLDPLWQVLLIALTYLGYELVAGLNADRVADAFENSRRVIDVETGLHIFVEGSIQSAVLGQEWLVDAANWVYVNGHFALTAAVLAWIYLRHNRRFDRVRNSYLIAMGIALAVYALMPVAPPRLFPERGFVDTLQAYAGIDQDRGGISALVNPYGAMPSMHVAFALLTGGALVAIGRRRIVRALGLLYPPLIVLVVVVTGNHFWLDAAAGALVAALSALLATRVVPRLALPHRRRWAMR